MRQDVHSDQASKGDGPYSQGIVANGFVFVSGQGPLDPESSAIVGETIEEQTKLTLENIQRIVESAGSSMDDVVKLTVYLTDLNDSASFNAVYREFFADPKPARTCVGAQLDHIRVEIDAVAKISK